jgi:hypothetical protein
LGPIGIYRKTAPTKSTVLGARPPPWNFNKIYRFFVFFLKIGPSIEPEKPSVKSASTANPPQKDEFIVIFIIYRVNCYRYTVFLKYYVDKLGGDKLNGSSASFFEIE